MNKRGKKLLVAIVAITLIACQESKPIPGKEEQGPEIAGAGYLKGTTYSPQDPFSSNLSSVSIKNGEYSVDSAIVLADVNRKTLVTELAGEDLDEKKAVAEIPEFIKFFLDSISGEESFNMADPGQDYKVGWFPKKNVPDRQLIYFGIGKNIALLSFNVGGVKKVQNVAIIKYEGEKVVDFWFEVDADPGTKKDEIIAYLKRDRTKNRC
jgi:hypothetical protein